jgi:Spy/CpxP family protein refolding chaperone
MERRLQVRINEVIRQRLALTDDQFAKLSELATRMEDDRRTLRNEELTTRFALRQELLAGDRVNETRVADMLDKLPKLERKRADLLEQEQRDLSKFLSPSQRARYFALQDELRRSMQDMQRRRMGIDSAADSAPAPRGAPRRPLTRRVVPPPVH